MAVSAESDLRLAKHRQSQRLAYTCAVQTARSLTVGVTEKEAAARLGAAMRDAGVTAYLHQPYAWFGDRAGFAGFRSPRDFSPSDRRLEEGMPAILDVAPFVDGTASDIGYAFVLGESEMLRRAMALLLQCRQVILERVLAEGSARAIYAAIEAMFTENGYRNCHYQYPFHVLAHRVELRPPGIFTPFSYMGFSLTSLAQLSARLIGSHLPGADRMGPIWGPASPESRVSPGLWAVEPHLGAEGMGAKWEEILVVTEETAYWLDDDVPHLAEWGSPPD